MRTNYRGKITSCCSEAAALKTPADKIMTLLMKKNHLILERIIGFIDL